jgi:ribosomal protein S4
MFLVNKNNRIKPTLKKLLKLKENVLNDKRILKLKKMKWEVFVQNYKRKLKRYKKYKTYDQNLYNVSMYPNRRNSYKKNFRGLLYLRQVIKLLYGKLSKKTLKKNVEITLNKLKKRKISSNKCFFENFENKLSIVIFRSKFVKNLMQAHQAILHGKVLVNNKIVKSKSYSLKQGDIVSININDINFIKENIKNITSQFLPPKHLIINYKTLQIYYSDIKYTNLSFLFHFNLNINKLLMSHKTC